MPRHRLTEAYITGRLANINIELTGLNGQEIRGYEMEKFNLKITT